MIKDIIIFIILSIFSIILINCAETSNPYFIVPQTLLEQCKDVKHAKSNKLTNIIDDIIENDKNHSLCKQKLEQWQQSYNNYIERFNHD